MPFESDHEDAALYDFVLCLQADEDAGAVRPVEDYVRRFHDIEAAVRREYAQRQSLPGPEVGVETRTEAGAGVEAEVEAEPGRERIGPYRLLRELGRGGQGTVYLAEDTSLGRQVALKVLSTPLGSIPAERLARFEREARVVARLDHPGICPIFEARLEAELAYIAMRHIAGETLAARIEAARARRRAQSQGAPGAASLARVEAPGAARTEGAALECAPRDEAELARLLTYFERAARALQAAHDAGVIHRDIKPGNMMVGGAGEPVLLDFGIARMEGAELETLTRSGDLFGTLAYMPPEQLGGGLEAPDARLDLYSLGATLFEALVLRPPFRGATPYALTRAILHAPVPDVSALEPGLPGALQAVLETALDKDPRRRYASARDFAEDLARLRDERTIVARRVGGWLRARRLARRRPGLTALLLALPIALLLGAALHFSSGETLEAKNALEQSRLERARPLLIDKLREQWRQQQLERRDSPAGLIYAYYWTTLEQTPESRAALLLSLDGIWAQRRMKVSSTTLTAMRRLSGERVLCADEGGELSLFELESGRRLDSPRAPRAGPPPAGIATLLVSESARMALTLARDGQLREWPLADLGASRVLDSGGVGVAALDLWPDRADFLAVRRDGRLLLGELGAPTPARVAETVESAVALARFDGSRRLLTVESLPASAGASASYELVARDVQSAAVLARYSGVLRAPLELAVAPDGRHAAVGERGGRVLLYALDEEGAPARALEHGQEIVHLEFDRAGQQLAVSHLIDPLGHTARVWRVASGERAFDVRARLGGLAKQARFSAAGDRLAVLSSDDSLRVFDTATGATIRAYEGLRNGSVSVSWDEGDRYLLAASASWLYRFYAEQRPFLPSVEHAGASAITQLELLPDGQAVASRARDGALALWSWPELAPLGRFEPASGEHSVGGAVFASGRAAWMAGARGELALWCAQGASWQRSDKPLGRALRRALALPDGRGLLLLPEAGPALLLDESLVLVQRLGPSDADYRAAAFDAQGERVALAGPQSFEVWSIPQGTRLAQWPLQASQAASGTPLELCFGGARGERLLLHSAQAVTPWDWRAGRAGPGVALEAGARVAFDDSGRGDWIAILPLASQEATLWSFAGAGESRLLRGHQGPITCLRLPGRSGGCLSSGSADGLLRVFVDEDGELLLETPPHDSAVTALAFDAASQRVISGTESGGLRVWPLELRAAARAAHAGPDPIDAKWPQVRAGLMQDILASME